MKAHQSKMKGGYIVTSMRGLTGMFPFVIFGRKLKSLGGIGGSFRRRLQVNQIHSRALETEICGRDTGARMRRGKVAEDSIISLTHLLLVNVKAAT